VTIGQHDRYIDHLTANPADRAALRAVAAGMEDNPMFAGRAEAILQELARPTPATHPDGREFTPEDALAYAISFAEVIGVPSDMASSTLAAIGDVDFDAISTQAIEDADLIQHVESAMRDDPSGYARNHDAQREYAEALERLNAPLVPDGTLIYSSRDADRRAEIEQAMRTDGGRPYWNSPAMQIEYGVILRRQTAPAAPPVSPVTDHG
jgi:hypothetical protein